MNKLHGFTAEKDYFVTLDHPGEVDPESVIAEFPYTHPILDVRVRELQKDIYRVNEGTRVKLCGSYFHSKALHWDHSTASRPPPSRSSCGCWKRRPEPACWSAPAVPSTSRPRAVG
ncbi:hypothetical protein ACIRYZ_24080 [Kitasatospora sp. NPDC101155]|uniref:hypothetical protein n=1 Tax=Kitasatospora sp. NPDC101155 TaxID=3364097 RepID=UPI00380CBE53